MSSVRDPSLAIDGMVNLRDAGGHAIVPLARVRRGLLYRGNAPGDLTERGVRQMQTLGLQTIVDLRETSEREKLPSPEIVGAANVHAPLYRGRIAFDSVDDLADLYRRIIDECADSLVGIVATLARPGAMPALIHCSVGKDRTGVVIALVLSAMGVDDEAIATDFGLTASAFEGQRGDHMIARSIGLDMDADRLTRLLASPPPVMKDLLQTLRSEYGGAEAYLTANGVAAESLAALRAHLTEVDSGR